MDSLRSYKQFDSEQEYTIYLEFILNKLMEYNTEYFKKYNRHFIENRLKEFNEEWDSNGDEEW